MITDELGLPVHPEWYCDEFGRLLKRARLRKIRLPDSWHTTLSLMEKAGVPISIVSKWAGHYDAAFTMKTNVHASDDGLKQGIETLASMHKPRVWTRGQPQLNGPQTTGRGYRNLSGPEYGMRCDEDVAVPMRDGSRCWRTCIALMLTGGFRC